HNDHLPFLDKLWNNGNNPIYVWIGISLDPGPIFGTKDPNYRQFMKYTVQWAAKRYGNHPALMGFVLGNETNQPAFTSHSDYWQYMNELHALVKASAPDKLTVSGFFDDGALAWRTQITDGPYAGMVGAEAYGLDVYGGNPYNNPALGTC